MWDLPRPGLEPVSPALAGRFSTTAPPGKPPKMFLKHWTSCIHFSCSSYFFNSHHLYLAYHNYTHVSLLYLGTSPQLFPQKDCVPCSPAPFSTSWAPKNIFIVLFHHNLRHCLFLFFLFFFFWPHHHVACRILVPLPGIEPMPLTVEACSPNHWTAREVPLFFFCLSFTTPYLRVLIRTV